MTGKFRTGVNPFDKGCIQNWKEILCLSNPPSNNKFRKKRIQIRNNYETKLLLNKYASLPSSIKLEKNNKNNVIYTKKSSKNKDTVVMTSLTMLSPNDKRTNMKQGTLQRNNQHQQNELELKYNNCLNQQDLDIAEKTVYCFPIQEKSQKRILI